MVKTSISHPLEIPFVSVFTGGRIGMALCPGKKQPQAVTGPWDRDLARDIDSIKAFGAVLLVSLMESHEMEQAAVSPSAMAEAAGRVGIGWLHLPIPDFQRPSASFEHAWDRQTGVIMGPLERGKGIVVHCRGGRGRSGLVAARLLVEFGRGADEAIAMVRSVNPLAMETEAQEDYIRSRAWRT